MCHPKRLDKKQEANCHSTANANENAPSFIWSQRRKTSSFITSPNAGFSHNRASIREGRKHSFAPHPRSAITRGAQKQIYQTALRGLADLVGMSA